MISYIELSAAALLPAIASVILFDLDRKGKFHRLSPAAKSILCGLIFGIFAILGTECGVPMNGAQINCRDAAVLIAGLFFGAPAGLIAGFIGGTERWFAVAWGIGTYTRVACTLSTYFAGIFSALISHFMLGKKKPSWGMALFIGITVEVFHMSMVFFTNINDATRAIEVIRSCTAAMLTANGLSVFAAALLIAFAVQGKELLKFKQKSETPVFETIQKGLLTVILFCLIATCIFVYNLENNQSRNDTDTLLENAISDMSDELEQQVEDYMLKSCHQLSQEISAGDYDLTALANKYGVSELLLVNKEGIVIESNVEDSIGLDISASEDSGEFLCLLDEETEYVQGPAAETEGTSGSHKSVGVRTGYGFLEMRYSAGGIASIVSGQFQALADNRHVGKSGSIIITRGNRILSISDGLSASDFNSWLITGPDASVSMQKAVIGDISYYYCTGKCEGNTIWAIYPVSEANVQRDIMVYLTIFLIILVFMAVYVLLYMIIKRIIVDQIVKMTESLSMISSGKLDEVVDVRSNEEFASLSNDINRTVDTLKHYIAEAAARIDAELETAAQIQISALPSAEGVFSKRKDFEIYAKMDPAKEVGGDFYDFYMTGINELNIMIADVSGKGIPAAMFMMRAKSTLKDLTETGAAVSDVFTESNNHLCTGNDAEMFVTAWQGKVHLDTGLVEFVNAGHNNPLVKHGDAPFAYLKQKRNLVLAAMEDIPYRQNELQLFPGDILLLYTDGVVEATNSREELYGDDRLIAIVNSKEFTSMKEMLAVIREDVDKFVGEAPQFDDLTMLALKYNGVTFEMAEIPLP